MNILVPIAGPDRYFPEEEFIFPKPLVDIAGAPLIERTVQCLTGISSNLRFTYVVQEDFCRRFSLDDVLNVISGNRNVTIVKLRAPTQGAVCSCLMAIDSLDPEEELLIANSDQVINTDLTAAIGKFRRERYDAAVVSFTSSHPRFSYIRIDDDGLVMEAEEKRVASRLAIAGLYYFRRSQLFIDSAKRVLLNDNRVQGSFYISQALNELVLEGKRIGHHQISSHAYFPLYSPQKIVEFEQTLFSDHATHISYAEHPVLVVPMAGDGQRFVSAGYKQPKPFIDVDGKPMIARVLDNLNLPHFETVLIARNEHMAAEARQVAELKAGNDWLSFVGIDGLTEGSVSTILRAREKIHRDAPLLIANCDQIVDFDCTEFVEDALSKNLDGSILVFREPARNPKWSYVKTGPDGLVTEAREKIPISDLATVGIYFFAKGAYFLDAALDMIAHNDRVNNEFYTCPVYNYLIAAGRKIGTYEIAPGAMHGIGIPDDLKKYLEFLRRSITVGKI